MEQNSKFRINLSTKEIEIEGSEDFVKGYIERLEHFVSIFQAKSVSSANNTPTSEKKFEELPKSKEVSPASFGEYLQTFPPNLTNVDKILIAGYYEQNQSEENIFTTSSAHELLKEQGIRLTNPSDSINSNRKAQRVIVIKKGKYRLSPKGVEYIKDLTSK